MNPNEVLVKQETEPVFLTNGACESAHGSIEVFKALKLPYGVLDKRNGKVLELAEDKPIRMDLGYEFFPLTIAEAALVGPKAFNTPEGHGNMAYSVLYKGKKWACPCLEIEYDEDDERGSNNAKMVADNLAEMIRPKVGISGGQVLVTYKDGMNDRHTLMILMPFAVLRKHQKNLDGFHKWLEATFIQSTRDKVVMLEKQVQLLWSVVMRLGHGPDIAADESRKHGVMPMPFVGKEEDHTWAGTH